MVTNAQTTRKSTNNKNAEQKQDGRCRL